MSATSGDQQQQQLRTWFDAIDTNRSGELDASELQQALRLGNLHFGLTDVVRQQSPFESESLYELSSSSSRPPAGVTACYTAALYHQTAQTLSRVVSMVGAQRAQGTTQPPPRTKSLHSFPPPPQCTRVWEACED